MPAAILKTIFSADTTQVDKGLSRLKGGLRDVRRVAGSVGTALAGALAVGGLRELLDEFDQFGKLAKRIGSGTDEIQKLGLAADMAGSDVETFANAVVRSQRKAAEGTDTTRAAFNALGIDMEAFAKMTPTEALLALEAGFASAGGGAGAMSHLFKIAEDDAKKLRQAFGGLGEAFDSVPTVDEKGIKSIERANDAWTKLTATFKALIAQPVATFLNGVQTAVDDVKEGGFLDGTKQRLNNMLFGLSGGLLGGDVDLGDAGLAAEKAVKERKERMQEQPKGHELERALRDLERAGVQAERAIKDAQRPREISADEGFGGALVHRNLPLYSGGTKEEYAQGMDVTASSLAAIGGGGGVGGGTLERQLREAKTTNDQLKPVSKWAQMQLNRGNANAEFRLLP